MSLTRTRTAALWVWAVLAGALLLRYYDRILRLAAGDPAVEIALLDDGMAERWVVLLAAAGLAGLFLPVRSRRLLLLLPVGMITLAGAMVLLPPGIVPGFPFLQEAALRAFGALIGASMVTGAVLGAGFGVLRLLNCGPADGGERLLLASGLGIGVLSVLSLLLMAVSGYSTWTLRILLGGGAAAAGMVFLRTLRRPPGPSPSGTPGARPVADRLWTALTAAACTAAFLGALAPETEYDALWYHLWLPKLWLEQGMLVDLVHEYITLYPSVWELAFAGGLACGGPVAAKLLHFLCFPLLLLLVHRLSRLLFPGVSPWPAVGLTAAVPLLLWEATTTYVDLALALHTGLILLALMHWNRTGSARWMILAGILLGIALGTKHLALFVLLIAGAGVFFTRVKRGDDVLRAARPALQLGVLALLVASFWYVRSFVASGNPFFPDLYGIFGARPPERWSPGTEAGLAEFKAAFGIPRSPLNLLVLPLDVVLHGARYGGTVGPLLLVLLPLAALLPNRKAVGGLAAALLAYFLLWASPIGSFQIRFLIPVIPVAALLAGGGFAALGERLGGGPARGALHAAAVLLSLLHLPPFISLHETDRDGWNGWLNHVLRRVPAGVVLGREAERTYLNRMVPTVPAWTYLERHTGPATRVLTFAGGDHYYATRPRLMAHATAAHAAVYGAAPGDEANALRELRRLGITHILYDRRDLEREEGGRIAVTSAGFFRTAVETVYADRRFLLCAVRPDARKAGSAP